MARTSRLLVLPGALALTMAVAAPVRAQVAHDGRTEGQDQAPLVIKVGTLAPEGTPWYDAIQETGARWKTASGGKITFTIFGSAIQGDEPAMILKMRTNQLQMGAFTTVGLEKITKEMSALWIPLLFQSYDELDYVRVKLSPRFDKALGDAGFVVLNWGDAGFVKYFANSPIPTLKALQAKKLFTWGNDTRSEEMYRDAGFTVVPLAATEILQALNRKMIDAFPAPPPLALANQWFGQAKNMMDIKFAPVVGGTIITKTAWDKIDPALRPTLLKIAQEVGEKYTPKIRGQEKDAIDAMVKRGLQIQTLTPQAEQEWQQVAEKFYPKIRGTIVPTDLFDEVVRLVKEYRATKAATPAPVKRDVPVKKDAPVKKDGPVKK